MRAGGDDVGEMVSGRSGRRLNADYACARSREKRLDCLGAAYMPGPRLKVNESACRAAMQGMSLRRNPWPGSRYRTLEMAANLLKSCDSSMKRPWPREQPPPLLPAPPRSAAPTSSM